MCLNILLGVIQMAGVVWRNDSNPHSRSLGHLDIKSGQRDLGRCALALFMLITHYIICNASWGRMGKLCVRSIVEGLTCKHCRPGCAALYL